MKFIKRIVALSLVLAASGGLADVRDTKHNLARTANGQRIDAREVCVFCHTPVVVDQTTLADGPQWQQSVPGSYSYILYDDTGRAAGDATLAVGSQSMVCLSCHDTNQAISASPLTYDHPFGVPYRGSPVDKSAREAAKRRAQQGSLPVRAGRFIRDETEFRQAVISFVDNREIWWVPAQGGTASRSKTDLPLYPRTDESGTLIPFIECTSCHDPHTSNALFLRLSNERSRLCLTCHII